MPDWPAFADSAVVKTEGYDVEVVEDGEAGTVEPGLHHVSADVQNLRRLLGGKLLDITQQNHCAVDFRQFANGRVQHFPEFTPQQLGIGQGRPIRNLQFHAVAIAFAHRHQFFER